MRTLVRFYAIVILTAQSAACLLWWILLALSPAAREVFVFPGMEFGVFNGLFLPDVLLYAALGAAGAILLAYDSTLGFLCLTLHCGAAAYATLMAAGLASASGGGMVGAVLMGVPTAAEGFVVWAAWKEGNGVVR